MLNIRNLGNSDSFEHKIMALAGCTLAGNFSRPIFILSAPRSGSTHLFEILRRMGKLATLDRENDPMWHNFFPYSRHQFPTDYVSKTDVSDENCDAIKAYLFLKLITKPSRSEYPFVFEHLFLRKPVEYLDKTIANCFHIEAIEKAFPDALFVHLVRDGRACVSSIIEGWKYHIGRKHDGILSFPPDSNITEWCYPIPPGWEERVYLSLEEICAWIWIEHNRYVLEFFAEKNEKYNHHKYIQIAYEDLIGTPLSVVEKISSFTRLSITQDCNDYIESQVPSRTTVSAPKTNKWKEKNPEAIRKILPMIEPMMSRLGYVSSIDA